MADKVTAFLALGSNIDDRMEYLAKAREMLEAHSKVGILKSSKIYETEPWPRNVLLGDHPYEEGGQKWFLNQVLKIETSLSPQELLRVVGEIEKDAGRQKRKHWDDREVDIDVLLYNEQVIENDEFQIPHRHMMDRQFVLVPLVEIAPDLRDPLTGHKFSDILKEVRETDNHEVIPFL